MCSLEKRGNIFILTLTGDGEHRLNPTLLDSLKSALSQIRSSAAPNSAALITTAHGKFFSNGYDLAWAKSNSDPATTAGRLRLMSVKLKSLVSDLISLPMPTIAAVTGHASAAGFIFALCHDYVLMRKDRGFLYMSEADIGLPLPPWFAAVVRCKIGAPMAQRDVLLRAVKLTGGVAAEKGIIDAAYGGADETVAAAVEMGAELAGRGWDGHVYGQIRMVVFDELVSAVGSDDSSDAALVVASRL